jgi:hypothetical protein
VDDKVIAILFPEMMVPSISEVLQTGGCLGLGGMIVRVLYGSVNPIHFYISSSSSSGSEYNIDC